MPQLIVWNSQGGKWDVLWDNWLGPTAGATRDDVVALVVEAGWAPWILSGDVTINTLYPLDSFSARFNAVGANASTFCKGMASERGRYPMWVPWVGNLNAFKTNTRCSMGGALVPRTMNVQEVSTHNVKWFQRPVIRVRMGVKDDTALTILLVHMISGWTAGAQAEVDYLTNSMRGLMPEGTVGVIVGDMNIDLLPTAINLPPKWRLLNTGAATQQSGGELDYALMWDPNGRYINSTATANPLFKTGANQSDHAVMWYALQ